MNWRNTAKRILAGKPIARMEALGILRSPDDELLALLAGAFLLRKKIFGRGVQLHVIRNARRGLCGEDCAFCSQSVAVKGIKQTYPMQTPAELVAGAKEARALDAARYCIVTSGRRPREKDLKTVMEAVRKIKRKFKIEICASLGSLTKGEVCLLKEAGVDRYNHNLETSARFFPKICSTHSYADRLATVKAVKSAGLELCCGGLIGMGETLEDRVDLAFALREVGADSIPVNFLDPRPGTRLAQQKRISARDALRALAMFRFVNPTSEIRVAGGREACLGAMQALALYPANSIFTNGYLTTGGQGYRADVAMIKTAGFHIAGKIC
jgi:biotin synthase